MPKDIVNKAFEQSLQLHHKIVADEKFIESIYKASDTIIAALRNGNKLLAAGNGGSAADAQHFVAELVGRFVKERSGLPAISLTTNNSTMTALANDYSYDDVFARQLNALGIEGDVFFGITTGGKSPNIQKALDAAKKKGIKTIGLLGKGGGLCAPLCDIAIIVPHDTTARIQEVHTL